MASVDELRAVICEALYAGRAFGTLSEDAAEDLADGVTSAVIELIAKKAIEEVLAEDMKPTDGGIGARHVGRPRQIVADLILAVGAALCRVASDVKSADGVFGARHMGRPRQTSWRQKR